MRIKMAASEKRSLRRYAEENLFSIQVGRIFTHLFAPALLLLMLVGISYATDTHTHGVLAAGASPGVLGLLSRITRDQGPEQEQALVWANLQTVSTPTAIRTDRKIKTVLIQIRLRLTNPAGAPTLRAGPLLLGTPLYGLIQLVTIRGQHLRYGAQQPITMRGETQAELNALLSPNYTPTWSISVNAAAATRNGALSAAANATQDIDMVLAVPMFPFGISAADIPFYSLHGPDWPGNLYVDVACGDGTCVATANAPAVSAFGSAAGVPTINILTERPLLSKDLMAAIRPGITFRNVFTQQPTAAVASGGGAGSKISDLIVGKDTTRIFLKTGTQSAGGSAGTVNYGTLLDSIVTRTFFSLDQRALRFGPANGDMALQDYVGRMVGRVNPIGYKLIDFIGTEYASPANPKAAFTSSKLTAARKFELDGDVTAAANQIAEVVQETVLGRPALLGQAAQ